MAGHISFLAAAALLALSPLSSVRCVRVADPALDSTRLLLGSGTIRVEVQSDWHFSIGEARAEADVRLLEALRPLARAIDPRLGPEQQPRLAKLWVDGSAVRSDRLEEQARVYGVQYRQSIDVAIPAEAFATAVEDLRRAREMRSFRATLIGFSVAGLILLHLPLALWLDRTTLGYRRAWIVSSTVFALTVELSFACWLVSNVYGA